MCGEPERLPAWVTSGDDARRPSSPVGVSPLARRQRGLPGRACRCWRPPRPGMADCPRSARIWRIAQRGAPWCTRRTERLAGIEPMRISHVVRHDRLRIGQWLRHAHRVDALRGHVARAGHWHRCGYWLFAPVHVAATTVPSITSTVSPFAVEQIGMLSGRPVQARKPGRPAERNPRHMVGRVPKAIASPASAAGRGGPCCRRDCMAA